MAKRKKDLLKSEIATTVKAAQLGAMVGSSVAGRDSLTRVTSPIKGVATHGKQWNRWSP